jgi:hypothetical protein
MGLRGSGARPRSIGDCPNHWVCFFYDGYFGSPPGPFSPPDPTGEWDEFGTADNTMSSWVNNKACCDARWAEGYNGNGDRHCMDADSFDAVIQNNDTASSYYVYNSNTVCGKGS